VRDGAAEARLKQAETGCGRACFEAALRAAAWRAVVGGGRWCLCAVSCEAKDARCWAEGSGLPSDVITAAFRFVSLLCPVGVAISPINR
jgi:hypothetical protein